MTLRRTFSNHLHAARFAALTVLEMMVAVTLLAVIMVGLLMAFNQTQRALHIASQQGDVFEATRGVIQMLSRDLAEVSDFTAGAVVTNCYSVALPSPVPGSALPIPAPLNTQPVYFGEAFWLSRANDDWTGTGYFVYGGTNSGIGTLYRFSRTARADRVPDLQGEFYVFTNSRPMLEGVVHFAVRAVHATNTSNNGDNPVVQFRSLDTFQFPTLATETVTVAAGYGPSAATNLVTRNVRLALPAFLEVELGVLEPAALKQYQAIASVDAPTAQNFLLNHVGQVHFFRERVPVRNYLNPYRDHEAP